jgi:class 3 adenylate cyclase/tetratricopeptide (TPR) repeat protein
VSVCQQCGEQNPDRYRICGMCGSPLGIAAPRFEARRTVTAVFCDLVGSTSLAERHDPEAVREALSRYFDEMRAVLERHGGAVEKYMGDAIMAVFGLVVIHEDDAIRAVRAVDEMRRSLAKLNDELDENWGFRLEQRIGVNTGDVVAGDAASTQRLVTGDAINVAARLEQAAAPGQILIGEVTYRLVRHVSTAHDLDLLDVKGKALPVRARELVTVLAREPSRVLVAGLVGRDSEIALMSEALDAVRDTGGPRMVTVAGPAGVGKSRLVEEFLAGASVARVLRGRCLSYGDGITFWPLSEAIRSAAAVEDDDSAERALEKLVRLCDGKSDVAERLAPLLGVTDTVYPLEETFWAARRLVEILAQREPVVVVFDDIHWAEPTLLDLIQHLTTASAAPVLILCTARGELFDDRPQWAQQANAEIQWLAALTRDDTRRLIGAILGSAGLPTALVDRISEAAGGNPLFVEQMLSMLVDDGLLKPSGGDGWVAAADLATVPVPPTVAALIAARLDRLRNDERVAVQDGSVVGVVFYLGALSAMVEDAARGQVRVAVDGLIRRQLIRAEPSDFGDDEAFRFDHVLIREVAYSSLLKRERARLHELVADWLEQTAGPRLADLDEIISYHLEQSARSLMDLGPAGEHTLSLATRASARLGAAGKRALSRGDTPAAANLLERAARLRPSRTRERCELLLEAAEALSDLGEFDRADVSLREALEITGEIGDVVLTTNARLVRLFVDYTVDPKGRSDEVVAAALSAVDSLEIAGDHAGLVRAWRLLGWVYGTACHYGAATEAVEHAIEHARLAGDRRAETRNTMSLALSALYGPMPVSEAVDLAERTLGQVADDRRAQAVVQCALAHLYALHGEFDRARATYAAARTTLEDLGGKVLAATVALDSGRVELLADELAAAEREIRRDYEQLVAIGEHYVASTLAGLLAEAVLRQGRLDEALELTRAAESDSADDDVESQNLWRRIRARILVAMHDGEHGHVPDTVQLVDHALALAMTTDSPVLRANTLLDRAEVLRAAGRPDEARLDLASALRLFEAKGDLPDAARAAATLSAMVGVLRSDLWP